MSFVHYLHEYFRHVGRNPEENGTLAITGICTLSMPHAPPVQIDDWTIWQTLTILRKALERLSGKATVLYWMRLSCAFSYQDGNHTGDEGEDTHMRPS